MTKKEERIQELEGLVRYHADLYYNQSKPEIADAEYDSLVDELKNLDPTNPVLQEVGAVPSYGRKVRHSQVMGSLDKETTLTGIDKWYNSHAAKSDGFIVTPKIDGLSVRILYRNGKLVEAASRGDGLVGQDLSDNIRAIQSIPKYVLTLASYPEVEVRGEIYMSKSAFNSLREQGAVEFANPRNAASGSLMAKDPAITASRGLSLFVYDVILFSRQFDTEKDKRVWMTTNLTGFDIVEAQAVFLKDFQPLANSWEVRRLKLDYEIDGLVLALNSIQDQEEAGWNGKRPRGKLAYKFRPEQKTTRVLQIDWQVGRTGRLTPMARIEPTLVSGSTLSNITLHNAANVRTMDVAAGDDVLVCKAGEIIPQIIQTVDRTNRNGPTILTHVPCPSCGQLADYDKDDEKMVNLWCRNPICPAQLERRVLHYVKTLDIMDVGIGTISGLCGNGFIKDVPDLYELTLDQIKEVTGGQQAAENVLTAILGKNKIPLAVFLDALGIDGLGTTTSRDVANKFKKFQWFRGTVPSGVLRPQDFTDIEGIADLTATKIITGLTAMWPMIERLTQVIDVLDVQEATGKLAGKTFLISGTLSKPRKAFEKLICEHGGTVASGVSKNLGYLIVGDDPGSKVDKAKKLGITMLNEQQLMEMIENG
jgi:DNA ligase (NAD+)